MAAIRSKVEKLAHSREQGALHHQCIDELTSHLRNTQVNNVIIDDAKMLQSPTRSETPTSFVTVIEVKDPSPVSTPPASSSPPMISATSISIAASNDNETSKTETTSTPAPAPNNNQPETTEDNQAPTIKCDENAVSTVHNVEVKRKIPPR